MQGERNRWYRLDDYQLSYDDAWKPDADAITAVNAHWVAQEVRRHGFNINIATTWQRTPNTVLDHIPILKYIGDYMLLIGERAI